MLVKSIQLTCLDYSLPLLFVFCATHPKKGSAFRIPQPSSIDQQNAPCKYKTAIMHRSFGSLTPSLTKQEIISFLHPVFNSHIPKVILLICIKLRMYIQPRRTVRQQNKASNHKRPTEPRKANPRFNGTTSGSEHGHLDLRISSVRTDADRQPAGYGRTG